jgi:predicted dithiol-disulfide oxidoreductase (DUF899 family)
MNFPNESKSYRAARNRLLSAEKALRRKTEQVAALRRKLPAGGAVPEDYVFDSEKGPVRLSELFGAHDTLIVSSFMYGPKAARPCPMCSAMLDGLNGNARHIGERASLVVIAKSPLDRILAFTRPRGWTNLRLLSSASNNYNRDYHGETAEGSQMPMLNVFVRRKGAIRHFWASELLGNAKPERGQDDRHEDIIWPLWNALDLTPEGRGKWYPGLEYRN